MIVTRFAFGCLIAACALLSTSSRASADPCTVEIHAVYAVPQTHDYVVTLSSFVRGTADLRLTLYSGSTAYAIRLANAAFDRNEPATTATSRPSRAAPALVRLPDDAAPPTAAVLELLDPSTKATIACSGDHERLDPATGASWRGTQSDGRAKPLDRSETREAADALMAAAKTAPVEAVGSPASVPTCSVPFALARTDRVVQARYPLGAQVNGEFGTVFVRVELSDVGSVVGATITKSSGYADLDAAGRDAAVASSYRPERFRCDGVAGLYLFQVDFARN